jgi:hypothetical protein
MKEGRREGGKEGRRREGRGKEEGSLKRRATTPFSSFPPLNISHEPG